MSKWPKDNQASLIEFYGQPGQSVSSRLVKVIPPFRMTYAGKPVPYLMFHEKAAQALERALKTVWDYYGHDQAKIDALGISKTAGTYNHRTIRGSTKWSNHAYGIAIDINAEQNGFNTVGNIPPVMIAAFKAEGARWGGDYKSRTDPMHFEFCDSGETERTFEEWLKRYGVKPVKPVVPKPAEPAPKNTYDESLERLLVHEGGYSDHPNDPGGATNFGITLNDYQKYINIAGTAANLRMMSVDQAKKIYREKYWNAMNCDALPAGVDYTVFDYGVNSGVGRAPKVLQRVVGVRDDGIIGTVTVAAIRDPRAVINAICDERMAYLRALPHWPTFGNGWARRVTEVRAAALAMAAATLPPHPSPPLQIQPPPTLWDRILAWLR